MLNIHRTKTSRLNIQRPLYFNDVKSGASLIPQIPGASVYREYFKSKLGEVFFKPITGLRFLIILFYKAYRIVRFASRQVAKKIIKNLF